MKKVKPVLPAVAVTLLLVFSSLSFNIKDDLQEAIRRRVENRTVKTLQAQGDLIYCSRLLSSFYEKRIYFPVWDVPKINQLVKVIREGKQEGLNPSDYHPGVLEKMTTGAQNLSVQQMADLDLLATDAFLLYTSHLLSGKVNPETTDPEWHVSRREGDPTALLQKMIEKDDVPGVINEALPKHTVYLSLKNALSRYEKIRERGGWAPVAEGETIKKGMESSRVGQVRSRLLATGDLVVKNVSSPDLYDDDLVKAVKSFQARNGLLADGETGKMTIAAMNIPVEERIEQIKVNLERWRWLPQKYSNYYIKVNIADFTLDIVKNGKTERHHKVIVGKYFRRTPVFSSQMSYLVLNPTWTVPPGILRNDILPAVRKNPAYLKTKNLSVLDSKGNVMDPSAIDWSASSVSSYTYRQAPGPDNALGDVKFMFPNKFSVYLHDTPSRELFDQTERSFSSGCVRVQNPLEMAEYLLNDPVGWNIEKIKKQVSTRKTLTLTLKEKPDIHILYWTAWTNNEGQVQFRKDIYDRDNVISKKLNMLPPAL